MFSGIVEEMATVVAIKQDKENIDFTLKCSFVDELGIDQSVAHNGVCLTVVEIKDGTYTVTAMKETLDRSNLGLLKVGDKVSLTDYRGSRGMLTSERSPSELGWSLAQRVPASTVDGWFGKGGKLAAAAPEIGTRIAGQPDRAALRAPAWVFTGLVLLTNVPIALVGGLFSWVLILLAIGVLWLPVLTDWMDD